jgi:hypothetical protein
MFKENFLTNLEFAQTTKSMLTRQRQTVDAGRLHLTWTRRSTQFVGQIQLSTADIDSFIYNGLTEPPST